jgi:hypothetical protein
MDSTVLIENTALEFWALTGGAPGYPCDIKTAITWTLPLEVYAIPQLCVNDVFAWTRRVNLTLRIPGRNRRLHGCLIAYRGKGTIFCDADDAGDEQRFTMAHELAHFLLDYQAPRQRAVNILGPSILPVLDGDRSPTRTERLHAVLSTVHLGVMSHVMERPDEGLPTNAVIDIEDRANRLALELLAPALPLCELMSQAVVPQGFKARLTYLTQHLISEYGLPEAVASLYARYVLHQLGEPTFRDWLFDDL